jgi:hypothetical protein
MLTNAFSKFDKREKNYNEALEMYKRKNYFTALDHIGKQYRFSTPDQNAKHLIEKILKHTGSHYFNTYGDLELRKMDIPETNLIMAKRNFYLKKYYYGHKRLNRIKKNHRLYPEARLLKGAVFNIQGEYSKAEKAWLQCSVEAQNKIGIATEKVSRYFTIIKEDCFINIARMKFKQKDYIGALKHYDSIPKNSFQWPYILLEKAWAHYYIGNYNNAIGTLITYNSPLLSSYFTPEAEVLKALSYYKLCLYDDALGVIENYYKLYTPKSNKLRAVINKNNSKEYFFNLMFTPISENSKESAFMRNLITQVMKRVKFNLDLNTLYSLNTEILRNDEKSNQRKLEKIRKDLKEQMNHYVKVSMYKFINQIHSLATEMFNLKLEILSDKRNLVYRNKISKKLKRGSFENVKRESHQEFWTFENAFWADELGDYSLGLKSQCIKRS